ncbi:MAG TPA: response regulator [Nitrospirae bacterium]|nr:response regulator [Nitrospirota bacterium]
MKKILAIDDEHIVRISCQRSLSGLDYDVKTASNGQDGLDLLEKEGFDLVLLDLKMPDMDGIEVLNKIKRNWPDTVVIMITGFSTVETAVKTLKLGAYNYIEKPFTPDALRDAVSEVLKT